MCPVWRYSCRECRSLTCSFRRWYVQLNRDILPPGLLCVGTACPVFVTAEGGREFKHNPKRDSKRPWWDRCCGGKEIRMTNDPKLGKLFTTEQKSLGEILVWVVQIVWSFPKAQTNVPMPCEGTVWLSRQSQCQFGMRGRFGCLKSQIFHFLLFPEETPPGSFPHLCIMLASLLSVLVAAGLLHGNIHGPLILV